VGTGNIHSGSRKTGVKGIMQKKSELQAAIEEIELLIRYAVSEEDQDKARTFLKKYRGNRVALRVLKEYYSSLPEAREEPVSGIVHMDMRQGIFLLGVSTGAHEYIFFATEDHAGFLGEYQEGIGDEEILDFFGYASRESFLQFHPTMAEFDDFSETLKINKVLCPVCSAATGEYHHLGCLVEVCPWCLGQLSRCNCRFDQMQKEEIESDEDLERFEAILQEKGRICFEEGQGPSYPAAGKTMKPGKKRRSGG
jgi:hypothetical protein